jgi:hypothetical protein
MPCQRSMSQKKKRKKEKIAHTFENSKREREA